MRVRLAQGVLVAALGMAGLLVRDSGCGARADDTAPALKKTDRLPDHLLVPGQYESLMQWSQQRRAEHERLQALKDRNPQVERERQRELRRGDFWRPGELYNLMGRPNDGISR